MKRLISVLLFATLATGCATKPVEEDGRAPDFRYTFIVDGKPAKSVTVPAGTKQFSVLVQPRSGESAIWQNHGATNVVITLHPVEREITPAGGRTLDLGGTVAYYRDVKTKVVNGFDEVIRGKAMDSSDVTEEQLTVEPGKPMAVPLAESLGVEITAIPKAASAPAATAAPAP